MIKFHEQVPSIYTSASRDFQYLSWLINIVLNSVKHNVDDIYNVPNVDSDPKITELLAMTLGFKVKRNYDKKQLNALVAVLPNILKYKGTKKAIEMTAEALVNASGSLGDTKTDIDGTEILVTLPKDLVDTTLFLDVLDYILPAGNTCRVRRLDFEEQRLTTKLDHKAILELKVEDDTNLAGLYESGSIKNITENITKVDEENAIVNTGLLDNTIIPTLTGRQAVQAKCLTLYTTEEDGSTKQLLAANEVELKTKQSWQEL